MWFTRHAHLKLYFSAIIIQSHVRGFVTRQRFLHVKEHRAATLVQVTFSRCVICEFIASVFITFIKLTSFGVYHPSLRIQPLFLGTGHCFENSMPPFIRLFSVSLALIILINTLNNCCYYFSSHPLII